MVKETQIGIKHIAIIMDGNRRWAKNKNLPVELGHKEGTNALYKIVNACSEIGVKYLTVYAFSTENWARSKKEVEYLMQLVMDNFFKLLNNKKKYKNCKIKILGTKNHLNDDLINVIDKIQEDTKNCAGLNLNIAFNYGGRSEITEAVKNIVRDIIDNKLNLMDINEQLISNYLYTCNLPDPEIILRTGGELRTSNFLPWQSVYSEYIFSDVLWPDFSVKNLNLAIDEFFKRKRNFGGG